jgi:predicted phage terminase large subunit-like protein
VLEIVNYPVLVRREINMRSFYEFLIYFWPEVSNDTFINNWHIKYLCDELQKIAERVAAGKKKEYDLIINIPPGSTKTTICSIMFPVWCWARWYWMRFITCSYSAALSLESAEYSRDLIRSARFRALYPELEIKEDKDTKSNFRVVKKEQHFRGHVPRLLRGGNRYSTSVGGALTGFHGHILIVDDPLDPRRSFSEKELNNANRWVEQTLSTRKVDKAITPIILIMQRLHQDDPTGHLLAKRKMNVKHICLPGEIRNYRQQLKPEGVVEYYHDGLLDPKRMSWETLKDLEADLGQYGYSGQIGQNPTPPGGGMFQVDHFSIIESLPNPVNIFKTVRYWDKAGSAGAGAYTVGVKIMKLKSNKYIVVDVKRGQWATHERERVIRSTAEADGQSVAVYIEQEPGSGGKESAENTIRNLAGYATYADHPTGDKTYRADPYSVQVNNGNVMLLRGDWNHAFVEEHRFFPHSTYKDQVDAAAGAFNQLAGKRQARVLGK